MKKNTGHTHVPVFVARRADLRPTRRSRRSDCGCMHALVDPFNEIELPSPALDLPSPERDESCKKKNCNGGGSRPRSTPQGMFFISCADIGIMLWFRWNITQIEPVNVMTTRINVKASAVIDQPPSTFVFMCRK